MQRRILSIAIVIMMTTCFGIYGCGEQTLLEETGDMYQPSLSLNDADEDGVFAIDTVWTICSETTDPDTGVVTTVYEVFTDVYANITLRINRDVPGLTLESYSINYTPLGSANGSGFLENPPDLIDPPDGYSTAYMPSGSTSTISIPIMTVDTKDEFTIAMGWYYENVGGVWGYWGLPDPDQLQVARYLIRLTLHFKTDGNQDKDITFDKEVYLSGYDNC